ncbi:MAG TPA: hypothetical protein PK509_11045 [Catalimonadaceae bacterium]|nr:hypothetical protein [Catalimonadaceae bacterium]HPI11685.1 hypothetical protein [Catalimonadaceae bacterium]
MEIISDLIKILLPASLVLLGIYLTIESVLKKQFEKNVLEIRAKNTEIILPVRLQAYERMALFLERISPHNLIIRINQPNMTAGEMQAIMLHEIREELNHNLSQQIYMTEVVWTLIRNATEDITSTINTCAQQIDSEKPSIELARKIFEVQMNKEGDLIQKAMSELKSEISLFY